MTTNEHRVHLRFIRLQKGYKIYIKSQICLSLWHIHRVTKLELVHYIHIPHQATQMWLIWWWLCAHCKQERLSDYFSSCDYHYVAVKTPVSLINDWYLDQWLLLYSCIDRWWDLCGSIIIQRWNMLDKNQFTKLFWTLSCLVREIYQSYLGQRNLPLKLKERRDTKVRCLAQHSLTVLQISFKLNIQKRNLDSFGKLRCEP